MHTLTYKNMSLNMPLNYFTKCCYIFLLLNEVKCLSHTLVTTDNCILTYKFECLNEVCSNQDTCECNEGYEKHPTEKLCVPKCDDGYMRVGDTCQPLCSKPCIRGQCVRPDECECNPGLHLNEENECVVDSICNPPCGNGSCGLWNQCNCHSGYKYNVNKYTQCQPSCRLCDTPICVAPGKCECPEYSSPKYLKSSGRTCDCSDDCDIKCAKFVCEPVGNTTKLLRPGSKKRTSEKYGDMDVERVANTSTSNGVKVPICRRTWLTGKTVHENCICPMGYDKDDTGALCIPKCPPSNIVVNGKCQEKRDVSELVEETEGYDPNEDTEIVEVFKPNHNNRPPDYSKSDDNSRITKYAIIVCVSSSFNILVIIIIVLVWKKCASKSSNGFTNNEDRNINNIPERRHVDMTEASRPARDDPPLYESIHEYNAPESRYMDMNGVDRNKRRHAPRQEYVHENTPENHYLDMRGARRHNTYKPPEYESIHGTMFRNRY